MIDCNLHYLFYKKYYECLKEIGKIEKVKDIEKEMKKYENEIKTINEKIQKFKILDKENTIKTISDEKKSDLESDIKTFELKTVYPGLLLGLGYAHAIGNVDDEVKVGFSFDYVTGMPYIPASSIKGTLRSAFKYGNGAYIKELLSELKIDLRKIDIVDFEKSIFGESNESKKTNEQNEPSKSNEISETKEQKDEDVIPVNKRDIFYDAYPNCSGNSSLLDFDYITPHCQNELKNPIPIKILKISPDVIIKFTFNLKKYETKEEIIDGQKKLELFKKILIDLGIGAKTNVGFGVLREDKKVCKECGGNVGVDKKTGKHYEICNACIVKKQKKIN